MVRRGSTLSGRWIEVPGKGLTIPCRLAGDTQPLHNSVNSRVGRDDALTPLAGQPGNRQAWRTNGVEHACWQYGNLALDKHDYRIGAQASDPDAQTAACAAAQPRVRDRAGADDRVRSEDAEILVLVLRAFV